MEPMVVDFETKEIVDNPTVDPPEPVGVSIKNPGFKSRYFAWGHPVGNNCEGPQKAQQLIHEAIQQGRSLLFQNAKFDVAVMDKWWGFKPTRIDDTLFLIFLDDPYAPTFSLKPSAHRILGIPPEEQDRLRAWILSHVPGATPSNFGAYISKAPADVVGPYANGDVDRTWKLYERIRPRISVQAYERELKLLPILMESERRGIRLDEERLAKDLKAWDAALEACDARAYAILGKKVDLGKGAQLADALEAKGLVTEWRRTPTGKRSVSRDNLMSCIAHPELAQLLAYRGALSHCLSNFARPWLALARNGRLHPEWNQVRQSRENNKDSKGTRTGRLSSTRPNFQNPPNEYEKIVIPKGLPDLPLMRQYVLPDKGYVWCKRDYSQQEMRILAHFSEGKLFERYQEDPTIDAHNETHGLIKQFAGLDLQRKYVKITGFSIVYGTGIPALSGMLGTPIDEAAQIKSAYFTALPEVRDLMEECKRSGRNGEPITTWGGRIYYVEPPALDTKTNRMRTFEYKLLNYLIQGSAADCTKESIIRWAEDPGTGQFLATVHDENDIQATKETWKKDMAKLNKAMGSIEFDVKMLSDGFVGKSWAELESCK